MNPVFRRQGILFVISAPSGTGKTTLCENLRATLRAGDSCTRPTANLATVRKGEAGKKAARLRMELF